jgi:tetratricopeptide (TPR) repeat protein
MTASVTAPASRNAPCPCGSGKRYKDCHGRLTPGTQAAAATAADPRVSERLALMREAIAAQQEGRLHEAIPRYQRVLDEEPANFDALHMLGVAYYQLNHLDRAELLMQQAIAVNPSIVSARNNLALLHDARRIIEREDALCRTVLARMAKHCATPIEWSDALGASGDDGIDVLIGDTDDVLLEALQRLLSETTIPITLRPLSAVSHGLGALQGTRVDMERIGSPGTTGAVVRVLAGVSHTVALWGSLRPCRTVALLVDRDAPALLHDRIRELSDEGRRALCVLYATPGLSAAIGLPGTVLGGAA